MSRVLTLLFLLCTNHLISLNKHPQNNPGCHFFFGLSFCPAQGRQTRDNTKGHLALIVTPCLLITSVGCWHIHFEDPLQSCRWHSTIVKKQVINEWPQCLDHLPSTAFKSCTVWAGAAEMFFSFFLFLFIFYFLQELTWMLTNISPGCAHQSCLTCSD